MEVHRVEQRVAETFASESWIDRTILVAVSGGPDSVACLLAAVRVANCHQRVVASHFNHRWRGNASNLDAEFVRQLCIGLGVRLVEGREDADTLTTCKTEESARKTRYQFLSQAAYELGASYIVTGHTADDRIETMLHNLMRGSGLAGLATPRTFRALDDNLVLVRPLLGVFRHEILDYLNLLQQDYRTDISNLNLRYARNFIRNRLLPLAREHFTGGIDKQLLSMSQLAEETMLALEELGKNWLEQMQGTVKQIPVQILEKLPNNQFWMVPRAGFHTQPWPVVREGLRQLWIARGWPLQSMSRGHWERIRDVLLFPDQNRRPFAAESVKTLLTLPGGLRLLAMGDWCALGMIPQENRTAV